MLLSVLLLLSLNVFSFYGLYTNKFYFLKFDNYIFPLLTIAHFIYLNAIWSKTRDHKPADVAMRNIEYILYFIFLVYVFKFIESIYKLTTYSDFEIHFLPETFIPIGITLVFIHFSLLLVTLLTFNYRKQEIGAYSFEDFHDNIEPW